MVVGITIQGRWLGVFVVRNGHYISASARTPQVPDFPSVRPLAPVAYSRNFPCTSAVLIVRPIIVGPARPVRAVGDPTAAAPPCSRGSSSSSSPRACSSHSSPRQSSPRRTTHPRHQGRASGAICSWDCERRVLHPPIAKPCPDSCVPRLIDWTPDRKV